jgi:hypothetical protein
MFDVGDLVSVYREKESIHIGVYAVTTVDGKQVFVRDRPGHQPRAFNVTAFQHAILPDAPAVRSHEPCRAVGAECNFSDILLSSVHTAISDCVNTPFSTYVTDIIDRKDPRSSSPEMAEAKDNELRGFMERGASEFVMSEEVPGDDKVLRGRFVLAIKEPRLTRSCIRLDMWFNAIATSKNLLSSMIRLPSGMDPFVSS